MSFFLAATVNQLRSVAESAMQDAVTINTPGTPVSDGAGGYTPGTSTTVTVNGWLRERSGAEAINADRLTEIGRYELWLPHDQAIDATATVTIGGQVYRVVYAPAVSWMTPYRAIGLELVV